MAINGATPAASRTPATTPMMQTVDQERIARRDPEERGNDVESRQAEAVGASPLLARSVSWRAGRMPSLPNSPSSCTTIDENAHT